MADAVLKQLGKYELTGVLGEGAMGVVYRAFDPVLNRSLAIKVMNSAIATDGALRERFLREARAAGSLQHPNVITIFDFGEVDGHLFIAMEFIDGIDLGEVMQHAEQVPIPRRLDIIIDALNGLAYAHSRGLVHRDIKPANIRVTTDHRAKLMDFGIARVESSELTQTGVMLGTPQYMSPEQVMGSPVTPSSDVFSMGAVLYEFLSGIKPFHGETLHAVLFNVVSETPRPVRELVPGLPPALDAVLAKALAKEVHHRYQDAVSMAKDLAEVRLALTASGESATIALGGRADLRSHSATALRDPELHSFIKRESAQTAIPARRRGRQWVLPGSIAGVAALAAVWFAVRGPVWPLRQAPAGAPDGAAAAASGPAAGSTPTVVPPATAPLAAAPSPAGRGGGEPPDGKAAPAPSPRTDRAAQAPPGAGRPATSDSALRALFSAATRARQRAQDAGATAADLAGGDSLMTAAEALGARGQGTAAAVQLSMASERWTEAERVSRAATAAASRTPEPASPAPERQRANPPAAAPAPPASSQPVAQPTEAAPKTTVDPRRAIEGAIAEYERAIESGDVNQIRRSYPGLTPSQQQGWESFFKSVRNFKATLAIDQVAVTGDVANAGIGAVYEYDNQTTGRADRQQLHLQATLSRESGAWRIVSIR